MRKAGKNVQDVQLFSSTHSVNFAKPGQVGQRFRIAINGGGGLAQFGQSGSKKFAKNLLLMGRFIHYCPLLARKLESGLETKNPCKSMKYKGIKVWPGTCRAVALRAKADGIACGLRPRLTQLCANLLFCAWVRLNRHLTSVR